MRYVCMRCQRQPRAEVEPPSPGFNCPSCEAKRLNALAQFRIELEKEAREFTTSRKGEKSWIQEQ